MNTKEKATSWSREFMALVGWLGAEYETNDVSPDVAKIETSHCYTLIAKNTSSCFFPKCRTGELRSSLFYYIHYKKL